MCGLTGLAGFGVERADMKFFQEMLMISSIRGVDATGFAMCRKYEDKKAQVKIKKDPSSPGRFVRFYEETTLTDCSYDVYLGHTRWGTTGGYGDEASHPFDTGRYVSAHNGTVYNPEYRGVKGHTDSEMMFLDMEKRGVKEVLDGLTYDSAYAVTIYDKETGEFLFARNGLRPLVVGVSRKHDLLYWGSEKRFMECAAAGNGQEIEYFQVPVGKLYSIHPKDIKANEVPFKVQDVMIKPWPKESKIYKGSRTYSPALIGPGARSPITSSLWDDLTDDSVSVQTY